VSYIYPRYCLWERGVSLL